MTTDANMTTADPRPRVPWWVWRDWKRAQRAAGLPAKRRIFRKLLRRAGYSPDVTR